MKRVVAMILALAVIIALVVFVLRHNNEMRMRESPRMNENAPEEVFKPAVAEESYLLIAEDNHLNIYKLGETATLKKSERINLSIFPQSDIKDLRNGIEYNSPEDAFAAMENYVG